jgi:hypothetical protein
MAAQLSAVRQVPDHPRGKWHFAPGMPEAARRIDEQGVEAERKRREQIIADNAFATQHNQTEASTASARWYVLHRHDKLVRRIQNHAAAQCGAKAKSTGQPCRCLAMPGKKRCYLHGGASTGPKNPRRYRPHHCRPAKTVAALASRAAAGKPSYPAPEP